jgi:hypothetical protein
MVAKEITQKIKEGLEGLWDLVITAYQYKAWEALGYDDWDNYCAAEFGEHRLRLTQGERKEVMVSLRDHGLSYRAIASATGYDKRTVARDLATTPFPGPPVDESGNTSSESTVVGVNGKKYRPRKLFEDSFWTTSYDLGKLGDKILKLAGHGDFEGRKERIKEASLPELRKARDTLTEVIDRLERSL